MHKQLTAAAILAFLSLTGCAAQKEQPMDPPAICTIRFWNGNELLMQQDVERGMMPMDCPAEQQEGLAFLGWDQSLSPILEDTDIYGCFAPELGRHVPYLFPDENGLLHPDGPFTAENLRSALLALAMDGAAQFFPVLPQGEGALSAGELQDCLKTFFPLTVSFSDFPEAHPLTRGEAAEIFNALLGRQGETVITNSSGFLDLSFRHPQYAALMEAAAPHRKGNRPWDDHIFSTGMAPGWDVSLGTARYFDEDGYLLESTLSPSGIPLDENGFCISGSAPLNAHIQQLLRQLREENPKADRSALLRAAYLHVRDSYTYLRKDLIDFGATGWEEERALSILETGMCNCYDYAAAFAALARGLGYDAWAVSGELIWENYSGSEPHGWTEILIDGEVYFCDPESEMAMRRTSTPWSLYMKPRKKMAGVAYRDPGRYEPQEDKENP